MCSIKQIIYRYANGIALIKDIYLGLSRLHIQFSKHINDKKYLEKQFKKVFGYSLDLTNPKTFNEKLQWLKLNDRNPNYIKLADKYEVRHIIKDIIGEKYLVPLIGVYDDPEGIDFSKLPDQFVLKATHSSGGVIICKKKSNLNIHRVKKQLQRWMKDNYYWRGREWPYQGIVPRIICEKYLVDESGYELKDYKIFCFNGIPKIIQVDFDRFTDHKRNLYDTKWNILPFSIHYPTDANRIINKPETLMKMLQLARRLSANYPHVRVDFYSIYESVYFGEITFYHGSGLERFDPVSFDKLLGSWLDISSI